MAKPDGCSVRAFPAGDVWHDYPCQKPPRVTRDGRLYCTIHDPEREKAEKDKREAAKAERLRPFREAVAALGCGWVDSYSTRPGIVLSLHDAQELAKRLK